MRAPVLETPVLQVRDLVVEFSSRGQTLRAVDEISFSLKRGKTLGVVGESGCGKSVTALSILRLIPSPPGQVRASEIRYKDTDLLALDEVGMRRIRGNKISMIFQEPMTSLNPVIKTGKQVEEAVRLHQGIGRKDAMQAAIEMFRLVGIPSPTDRVHSYPHQMSGGMRQRVMIAIALACKPDILIADEPTTALDVTIQAQILELLGAMQETLDMSILLITHDLGLVAQSCQDVVVMYAGRIVERCSARALFKAPLHPYTLGLLHSMPGFQRGSEREAHRSARHRLQEIPGMVPPLGSLPSGCSFQERCIAVTQRCREEQPAMRKIGEGQVRCHHPLPTGHMP